jgi:electron-transferring-flavoprotein dehydrogenase
MTLEEAKKIPRESDETDVLIVGGGPAGLSAAIRLKQLCNETGKELRVTLLEKGGEIGNHILSGAVMDPKGMNELFPNWKELGAPLRTAVTEDHTYFLTSQYAIPCPVIAHQQNHGNYIVSLSQVTKWMAEQAEQLGVEIYPGFSGSELLYDDAGAVVGVATGDQGIGKNGQPTSEFQRGMELRAPITLFAEGVRGSLTKQLLHKYQLAKNSETQTYGIGLKEVWEVSPEKFKKGSVTHTLGWPVDYWTYGGSFMYHWEDNKVAVGYVVGLDYKNPYMSPYQEFQRWKQHPSIRPVFEGGKCLAYGARAINEGGVQSLPELVFPGGALLGCGAGFLNVPKIKGSHNAIKSGILAAESAFDALKQDKKTGQVLQSYPVKVKDSWLYKDLYEARNIRPSFHWGLIPGILYSGIDWLFMKGREPWTLHHGAPDHERTEPAAQHQPIQYPKPDGVVSFDLLTNVARTGTNHNEDQPAHLKLTQANVAVDVNLKRYAGLESRYCPAGVYEFPKGPDGSQDRLQINAQNCIHCKTCDIKDPTQNITWTTPEGGGGPGYTIM